ncbi:hypothetical protein [Metabacillus sp. 84]
MKKSGNGSEGGVLSVYRLGKMVSLLSGNSIGLHDEPRALK